MGIHVYWDNDEQTILRCEFDERWSWDDLHHIATEIQQMNNALEYELGSILNLTNGIKLPSSLFSRESSHQFFRFLQLSKNGKTPIIIAGKNKIIKVIFNTMGKMDKHVTEDVYFADTLAIARAKMQKRLQQGQIKIAK